MSSTLIEPSKRGTDLSKLTDKERKFVNHYNAHGHIRNAVKAAYPNQKRPDAYGFKLLQKPKIQRALGIELQHFLDRNRLEADNVLDQLSRALFHNPLRFFKPGPNGTYTVDKLEDIPDEIGALITKVKLKTVETDEGITTYFELELIDKNKALQLAMQHLRLLDADGVKVNVDVGTDLFHKLLAQVEETPGVIDAEAIEQ